MSLYAASLKWTGEEDRRLKTLWDADWSINSISSELGRSRSAIAGRARRIGLPARENPVKRLPGSAVMPTAGRSREQNTPLSQDEDHIYRDAMKAIARGIPNPATVARHLPGFALDALIKAYRSNTGYRLSPFLQGSHAQEILFSCGCLASRGMAGASLDLTAHGEKVRKAAVQEVADV